MLKFNHQNCPVSKAIKQANLTGRAKILILRFRVQVLKDQKAILTLDANVLEALQEMQRQIEDHP